MKSRASENLAKAREALRDAKGVAAAGFNNPAAHSAYIAALQTALAIVFERTGKTLRSQESTNIALLQIANGESQIGEEFHDILTETFELVSMAERVGPSSTIPVGMVRHTIDRVTRFVDCIAAVLEDDD